jgi:hypothetical protein
MNSHSHAAGDGVASTTRRGPPKGFPLGDVIDGINKVILRSLAAIRQVTRWWRESRLLAPHIVTMQCMHAWHYGRLLLLLLLLPCCRSLARSRSVRFYGIWICTRWYVSVLVYFHTSLATCVCVCVCVRFMQARGRCCRCASASVAQMSRDIGPHDTEPGTGREKRRSEKSSRLSAWCCCRLVRTSESRPSCSIDSGPSPHRDGPQKGKPRSDEQDTFLRTSRHGVRATHGSLQLREGKENNNIIIIRAPHLFATLEPHNCACFPPNFGSWI